MRRDMIRGLLRCGEHIHVHAAGPEARDRSLSRPGIGERFVQALLFTRDLERTSADLGWMREARTAYSHLHGAPPARAAAASRRGLAGRSR